MVLVRRVPVGYVRDQRPLPEVGRLVAQSEPGPVISGRDGHCQHCQPPHVEEKHFAATESQSVSQSVRGGGNIHWEQHQF